MDKMVMYAPRSISEVEFHVGGCGSKHSETTKDGRLVVNCQPCELMIQKYETGWARNPEDATPTEAESAERRAAEADSQRFISGAGSMFGAKLSELIQASAAEEAAAKKRSAV